MQVLKLFTLASGLSDAHASPAPLLPGDSWLLVVIAGVCTPVFRVESHVRVQGMQFVPRNPVTFAGSAFQTAHAVSPMPLTLAKSERCLICASNTSLIRIHLR
ncbi:hypothetical protein [Caballeronia catudaia]|uniref:hypothetical protein n=1 Tax=Caballeronia catudaia TaxID=1777136 RepID=UPI00117FFC97|nr:hypothetical protein [Caballeronia catudaia]